MSDVVADMALTGGASALLGAGLSAVGKLMSSIDRQKQLAHARNLDELKAITESMNQASSRGGKAGSYVRRFMVVALFMFMFAILPINAIIQAFIDGGPDATFVYVHESASRWFGLLPAKSELRTAPIEGIPIFRTFVEMGWLMASFYFGSSRIK